MQRIKKIYELSGHINHLPWPFSPLTLLDRIFLLAEREQAEKACVLLVVDHVLDLLGGEARAEVEVVEDLDRDDGGGGVHDDGDLDGGVLGTVDVVRVADAVGEVEGGLGALVAGAEDLDHVQFAAATLKRALVITLPAAAFGVLRSAGDGGVEQPVRRHVLTGTTQAAVGHRELDNEDLGSALESLCHVVSYLLSIVVQLPEIVGG